MTLTDLGYFRFIVPVTVATLKCSIYAKIIYYEELRAGRKFSTQ